ncbi:hypothetical protein [Oenococcus sicerae]|uniref:hypothetical protein n=1 Tax=Oenococcus sicerae TaxID=2203724 RepID=UPI0039EBBDF6
MSKHFDDAYTVAFNVRESNKIIDGWVNGISSDKFSLSENLGSGYAPEEHEFIDFMSPSQLIRLKELLNSMMSENEKIARDAFSYDVKIK